MSRDEARAGSVGDVAIVLHAHLPWTKHPEHATSLEEGWLYEALWECYLPLVGLLTRIAERGRRERPACTLSVSPPLACMLRDAHHRARFEAYADRLESRIARARADTSLEPFAAAIDAHAARLLASRATWKAWGGDVTRALAHLADAGVVELGTTSATHAYLPGLRSPAAVRAQLRLGIRHHLAVFGREPDALWLPECGFDERLADDVAACGARYTVLERHGLELAQPRPLHAPLEPIVGPGGVAYFGRDAELVERVWSRARGYPNDPAYREFHRDLGTNGPSALFDGDVDARGPHGERLPSGLRPWAVTGSEDKRPYRPEPAALRAVADAADFACALERRLIASRSARPVSVLAFDAELFGHWWWEGPAFLEALVERLDGRDGRPAVTSLGGYLARDPELTVAMPAASSWGEGGFADVWASPSTAHLFRVSHRATRRLAHVDSIVRDQPSTALQRAARVLALREAQQLEASDFGFMLRAGEFVSYAESRLREHATNVEKLTAIATSDVASPEDEAFVLALEARGGPLSALDEDAFADALDAW